MEVNTLTPKTNETQKLMFKDYELDLSKEKYSLSLYISKPNEIFFHAKNKNSINMFNYKIKYTYEQLKKLYKCFIFYDTLEDMITCIQTLLDENKGKLSYDNDILILSLSFFLPTGMQDEIKIVFEKENVNKDSIIQNLCDKIKNLENYVNILIKSDQKKDSMIKLLEQRIEKLEQKEKSLINLEEIKQSSIINKDEINIVLDELKNHDYFKTKNIGFKLIYKAAKDGHLLTNFHNKCDNKEQCIIFFKNKKGKRFGGYTQMGFNSNGKDKDDNAFVFSLDSKKIFKVKKGCIALYNQKNCIGFKNTIYLYDGDLFNNSYLASGSADSYDMKGYELSSNYSSTIITEIELYQISSY